jgi:hypothetical protein
VSGVVGRDLLADGVDAGCNLVFGEENFHFCGGWKDGAADGRRTCWHKAA